MDLSIIIVSYSTKKLLQTCLESVCQAISYGKLENNTEVIVVDNASTDGSYQMVKEQFSKVKLISNKKNLGFAAANNLGIESSKGSSILLLNSDTKVFPETLGNLLEEINQARNTGVIGAKLLNRDGSVQSSAGFSPSLWRIFAWMVFLDDLPLLNKIIKAYHIDDKKFYEKMQNIDWVSGACLLFKRQVFEKTGPLDEKIFMYGEEVEWCYRVRKLAFDIIFTPKAALYHAKGASGEGSESGIVEEFAFLQYFYRKHKPLWQSSVLTLILKLGALLRLIIFGIIKKYPKRVVLYAKILKMAGR